MNLATARKELMEALKEFSDKAPKEETTDAEPGGLIGIINVKELSIERIVFKFYLTEKHEE